MHNAHADSNYTYVPGTPTYLDDDSNMSDSFRLHWDEQPELPQLELSQLELPQPELPQLELSQLELP